MNSECSSESHECESESSGLDNNQTEPLDLTTSKELKRNDSLTVSELSLFSRKHKIDEVVKNDNEVYQYASNHSTSDALDLRYLPLITCFSTIFVLSPFSV